MYALGPVAHFSPADIHRPRRYAKESNGDSGGGNDQSNVSLQDTSQGQASRELITYIIPDFRAVSYFQKEFIALNEFHLAEEGEASGFEIYLVDQWIRGRKIGGVISTYTGSRDAIVKVIKFTIIRKPSRQYPPRFQEYLNEVMMNHATFKKMEMETTGDTDAGNGAEEPAVSEFLLVTNLAALPSTLNLIPVPEGDMRIVEKRFVLNSNLKKLNCGGRSLSLAAHKVSDASEDKFRQMYKLRNDSVPIEFAVRQLVNLIQTCLFYFDYLDARYCDGIFCQKTEDAITNWWSLIGLPHFNVKPNPKSGILPSKTVAAILSLTLSVRLRLQLYGGCDVPKDVFDFENFMLSIGHFQKQVKIEKKRKLDLITLSRLFNYTNQKYPSDSTKRFGDTSDDEHEEFYDPYVGTYSNGKSSQNGNSLYKKNKIYYSKELKKLTNVVKNTVQDHIIVREDDDTFFDPKTASSGKIRSKIASKLTDNVLPSDIETLDLDFLVRKHLTGRTLKTLWLGANYHLEQNQRTLHVGYSRDHKRHGDDEVTKSEHRDSSLYKFVSLKDAITMNQSSSVAPNDRSKRSGRMRFGFQARRGNLSSKIDMLGDTSKFKQQFSQQCGDESFLDAQLNKLSNESAFEACKKAAEDCNVRKILQHDTRNLLNRRNSFSNVHHLKDSNLNTIEYIREERNDLFVPSVGYHELPLRRSISGSNLEEVIHKFERPICEEKICMRFLQLLMFLAHTEKLKAELDKSGNDKLRRTYKHINFELVKLQNFYSQMQAKHHNIEENYSAVLVGRMRDITDNIDRMAFRSRDLSKKINELEDNTRKLEFNLQNECVHKFDEITKHLIHSPKFLRVFKDDEERQKVIFSLTGRDYIVKEDKEFENNYWGLRYFITCLYELMVFVLQMFNFDRSKMDLDRIRKMYRKIDPNRRFIDKAYRLVGQEPSKQDSELQ
ncbi:hypothetical protein FDK38_003289 [Candidozyma auris]|nr:hypothetical protein FDK38_003289 [[Candida] auris]